MSSVGIVMLIHTALHRAEQVARHWLAAGCPVVLHVDRNVAEADFNAFRDRFLDHPQVLFSDRHRCEWGTWGIVAASQAAGELMLERFHEVTHVYLASGSCLPLRPVKELQEYLAARPQTDFIESATTTDVPWIMGGLGAERFTLRFPFSWKRHRRLFDGYVRLQRRLGVRRRVPEGLNPHLGSQWWCLTRKTLSAILTDPRRAEYDTYFRRVWIPDECYYQTLTRLHSVKVESRSLTLSKFDYQGKPHVFYDDHLQLLRRSDCFVARKIWPQAERLYQAFLSDSLNDLKAAEPNPGKIDRLFSKAVERRTEGRPGLYMQSRMPSWWRQTTLTCAPYSVFQGFSDLFEDFEPWLRNSSTMQVHGHLFAKSRAEFAGGATLLNGGLSDSAHWRDHNPWGFLANLIWNTRGVQQGFQFGPEDAQKITEFLVQDANAQIAVISGAWAVPLFLAQGDFEEARQKAARLQGIEATFLKALRARDVKARVWIWTMADFVEAPQENLQALLDAVGGAAQGHPKEMPKMANLEGFGHFLQDLKNQGMHPYLMGDFSVGQKPAPQIPDKRKPYLVR